MEPVVEARRPAGECWGRWKLGAWAMRGMPDKELGPAIFEKRKNAR